MKVGIMGLGQMGEKMAIALNALKNENIVLYACASRSQDKANNFKEKYNIEKAYGSYIEMVSDKDVDLVYIATPISMHHDNIKLALEHGKHVICEKSFCETKAQAEEVIALAKKNNLYLAEGMWSAYMESRNFLDRMLKDEEIIGANADFSKTINERKRTNPELKSGALQDLGVYPISFLMRHINKEIKNIVVKEAVVNEYGIETKVVVDFEYDTFKSNAVMWSDYAGRRCDGKIDTKNFTLLIDGLNNVEAVTVIDKRINKIADYEFDGKLTDQVVEAYDLINQGVYESKSWTFNDILKLLEISDYIKTKLV